MNSEHIMQGRSFRNQKVRQDSNLAIKDVLLFYISLINNKQIGIRSFFL